MADIATLGLKFKLDGADQAKTMLDQLTTSAGQVGKAAVDSNGSFTDFASTVAGMAGEAGPYGKLAEVAMRAGVEMHKGAEEQVAFQNALTLTGNYAGMTETALFSMSQSIAASSGVSAAAVREIELQLVKTGQVGPGVMRDLTEATALYARATGTDAALAASKFTPLLGDTTTAALALNGEFHALTYEQLENVKALQAQGDKQGAIKAVIDGLRPTLSHQTENLGYLEQGWRSVTNAISGAIDELRSWGRAKAQAGTLDAKDAEVQALWKKRTALQKQLDDTKTPLGAAFLYGNKGAMADAEIKRMRDELAAVDRQYVAKLRERDVAAEAAEKARSLKDVEEKTSVIMLSGQGELLALKEQEKTLQQAITNGIGEKAKVQAKLLEVQKQIAALENRGTGSPAPRVRYAAGEVARQTACKCVNDEAKRAKAFEIVKQPDIEAEGPITQLAIDAKEVEAVLTDTMANIPSIVAPARSELSALAEDIAKSFGQAIASGQDLGDALSNTFRQIAASYVTQGIKDIFASMGNIGRTGSAGSAGASGGGGDIWSTIFSGFSSLFSWDGGGYTGDGSRSGGVDGKGGFLAVMHPRETVIDHTKGGRGGGGQAVQVAVSVTVDDDGKIRAYVRDSSARAVQAGLSQYDAGMPQRVAAITNDPRRR